jgi:hypothetical protein
MQLYSFLSNIDCWVAWMQRSLIRDQWHDVPDYASLHPGYRLRLFITALPGSLHSA